MNKRERSGIEKLTEAQYVCQFGRRDLVAFGRIVNSASWQKRGR